MIKIYTDQSTMIICTSCISSAIYQCYSILIILFFISLFYNWIPLFRAFFSDAPRISCHFCFRRIFKISPSNFWPVSSKLWPSQIYLYFHLSDILYVHITSNFCLDFLLFLLLFYVDYLKLLFKQVAFLFLSFP